MVMDTWRLSSGTALAQAQSFQLATAGKAWLTPNNVRERIGMAPLDDDELEALNPPTPAGTKLLGVGRTPRPD